MEPVLVVPLPVLPDFAQPLRKLPQQADELLGDVPDGPLDLSLVLWVVRVREQRSHAVVPAPSLPRFLELTAVVREDLVRLPSKPLQEPREFIGGRLVGEPFADQEIAAVVVYAHRKPVPLAMKPEWSLDIKLPQFVLPSGPEEFPGLGFSFIAVEAVAPQNLVYRDPREADSLDAHGQLLPHELGEVDQRLLDSRGSPSELGPEFDNRKLYFLGDLALLRPSRQVPEALPSAVLCPPAPLPDSNRAHPEDLCHYFFTQPLPNHNCHLAALFGCCSHRITSPRPAPAGWFRRYN